MISSADAYTVGVQLHIQATALLSGVRMLCAATATAPPPPPPGQDNRLQAAEWQGKLCSFLPLSYNLQLHRRHRIDPRLPPHRWHRCPFGACMHAYALRPPRS